MFNQLRKNLQAIFLFLLAISVSIALTGCMPKVEKTEFNGVSASTLNKPNVPMSTVLVWANEAAAAVYSYDFVTYQKQLQTASQYFTPEGWQTYMTALTASGNLDKVVAHKMVVSAVDTGAPIILSQGELAGRYSWKVQMPLLVTYQNASIYQEQHLVITMLIVRTSPIENTRGLGIQQFVASVK